jgi:hypothetical protein
MQNTTDAYTVEITTSTDSNKYTKAMIASIEHTKTLVTKRLLRDMLWGARPKGANEYIHGIQREATTDSKATAAVK